MFWTTIALTRSGQEVTATLFGSKEDILKSLSNQYLTVIEIKPDYKKILLSAFSRRKLSALSLAVFFEDFSNMLATGMNVSQILLIIKETSHEEILIRTVSILEEKLVQGQSLTEALADLNIFPWIVSTTLSAGERTGRLFEATVILAKYFRSSYQIKNKMQQALTYPIIVFILLLAVMFFISLRVIPQLRILLPTDALHHQTTQFVLILSSFLQEYAFVFLSFIVLGILGLYFYQKNHRYLVQQWVYTWPILGDIFKESTLALYLLNLSVLLRSGVTLLKTLEELNTVEQTPVSDHFFKSREYILGGLSFWQAIEGDRFFPVIISSTFRRAEEMVKLDEYCLSLAEYFNRRVSSKLEGLVHCIQPGLLALGGAFLVIIAVGFILPIYGSLTTIADGQ